MQMADSSVIYLAEVKLPWYSQGTFTVTCFRRPKNLIPEISIQGRSISTENRYLASTLRHPPQVS